MYIKTDYQPKPTLEIIERVERALRDYEYDVLGMHRTEINWLCYYARIGLQTQYLANSFEKIKDAAERCEKLEAQRKELREWVEREHAGVDMLGNTQIAGPSDFSARAMAVAFESVLKKLDEQDQQEGVAS